MNEEREALARWLEKRFGDDVSFCRHPEPMRFEDWLWLADDALRTLAR